MSARGYWAEDQNGDRRWYAAPERERCGGGGYIQCYCGGDLCVCGNQGEIECFGCEDCDRYDDEDDWGDDEDSQTPPPASPLLTTPTEEQANG